MKLSHVFIFNTLAGLSYAAGFLIIPATIMSWHGITADANTILMARYFGVALLGIGLVTWLVRNAPESNTRDGIAAGLARGASLDDAVGDAKAFVTAAIRGAEIARGTSALLDHIGAGQIRGDER